MDFKIEQVFPKDKSKIGEFLHKSYYPDDPVLNAINLTDADETHDEHILGIIDEGFSYAAFDRNGNILSVLLMGEVNHNSNANRDKEIESCTSQYFTKLLKFYKTMAQQSKLLEVPKLDKGLEFHIAAVSPSARRKGIMRALFLHGTNIALENNYKMVICTCASQYTANLCQSLNWSCVYCLPYIYYEQDGEQIFKNPVYPHLYSRIYVQYL